MALQGLCVYDLTQMLDADGNMISPPAHVGEWSCVPGGAGKGDERYGAARRTLATGLIEIVRANRPAFHCHSMTPPFCLSLTQHNDGYRDNGDSEDDHITALDVFDYSLAIGVIQPEIEAAADGCSEVDSAKRTKFILLNPAVRRARFEHRTE